MSVMQHDPGSGRSLSPMPVPDDDPPDLRHYLWVIRRRRGIVISFFVSVVLSVAAFSLLAIPMYTAETVLLIEWQSPQVLDIEQVLAESLGSKEHDYYKTQYEILQSRTLAAEVIRELELDRNDLKPRRVALSWPWEQDEPGAPESKIDPSWIDAYLSDRLEIEPLRKSRLVRVRFSSPDPELSARIVNAHVQAYIRQGLTFRNRASLDASGFLEGHLADLEQRLQVLETALNRYRRSEGILSIDEKESTVVERLADLNRRLTEVEAKRIGYEAQVRVMRGRDREAVPAVINNALLRTLKEDLARVEAEYSEMSARFGPGYPRLWELGARVREIRQRLDRETRNVLNGIESAFLEAQAVEQQLRETLEEQKTAVLHLKSASVEYAILAREVEATRQLYDTVLQRVKETSMAAQLRASNVFVIDPAQPPQRRSSPRTGQNMALALVLGAVGGLGLAFAADYLDNTLRSPAEAERYLGIPRLGVIPDFVAMGRRNQPQITGEVQPSASSVTAGSDAASDDPPQSRDLIPPASAGGDPFSVATEAYRAVRTALMLSRAETPPRVIAFTSATTSEGKTITTLNMAVMFAQLGGPVLVMDADLRRPRCHEVLGTSQDIGLTEVMTGHAETSQAIQPTRLPFYLLPSGKQPPSPTELLGSRRMEEILTSLRDQYAYILIDAPPLMAVSDMLVLSAFVDGVVLVIDQQSTPRQMVREATERLERVNVRPLGFVLNRVDVHAAGYMYDLQEYYG